MSISGIQSQYCENRVVSANKTSQQTKTEKTEKQNPTPDTDTYVSSRQDNSHPRESGADEEKKKVSGEKEGNGKCTINTDKVDAEIQKLRKKRSQLKQQIAQSGDNPQKQESLKNEFSQLES